MIIQSDDELTEQPSMAKLLELERLSVEVAVLRDDNATAPGQPLTALAG